MATQKNTTNTEDPQKSEEKKEYEYKKITRRRRFSPEVAHKTIEQLMDHFGINELTRDQTKLVSKMIEGGRLGFAGGVAKYKLSKKIEVHGGDFKQTFDIQEPTDKQFKTAGIDILGIMQSDDVDLSGDDMRGIAALTIGLATDFKDRISLKDVTVLNGIYTLFYLSQ